jgi:hypothetical protein
VDDFIAKIEADAAARGGIYDPKTGGFFHANVASLEGDIKNTAWYIPSNIIYDAKAQGKKTLNLEIGDYPAPVASFTTIKKGEGLSPQKEMQIYAGYGNKNWVESNEIVIDKDKRGELKNIL